MFWLYIQQSSGLKEISPGTKNVYFMESHKVHNFGTWTDHFKA